MCKSKKHLCKQVFSLMSLTATHFTQTVTKSLTLHKTNEKWEKLAIYCLCIARGNIIWTCNNRHKVKWEYNEGWKYVSCVSSKTTHVAFHLSMNYGHWIRILKRKTRHLSKGWQFPSVSVWHSHFHFIPLSLYKHTQS